MKHCELTLEHVGHFAELGEAGAVRPGVHDVHHEGAELLDVLVLLHRQLRLGRDARDAPCRVLRATRPLHMML